MKAEGSCHCGAIRYAIAAKPTNSMICHCKTCLTISGAPVVAWITVAPNAYAVTQGRPKTYKSSARVERTFCGQRGTQLTYARNDELVAPGFRIALRASGMTEKYALYAVERGRRLPPCA